MWAMMPMLRVALESKSWCGCVDSNRRGVFTWCRKTRRVDVTHPTLMPETACCDTDALRRWCLSGARDVKKVNVRALPSSANSRVGQGTRPATSSHHSTASCSCPELQLTTTSHGLQRPRPGPPRRPRPMGIFASGQPNVLWPTVSQRYPLIPAASAGFPVP